MQNNEIKDGQKSSDSTSQAERAPNSRFSDLPNGYVGRCEAARILGMSIRTLSTWESDGRVSCGRLVPVAGKPGTAKVYPVEALRQLKSQFETTRQLKLSEPFPPPGFVTREQACRIIGIKLRTLWAWEHEGRLKHGIFSQLPGKPGRCRLYPCREVSQLAEDYKRAKQIPEPYPDPERPGCFRVKVTSGKHEGMEAIIDAESLPLIRGSRWWWSPGNKGHGTVVLAIDGTPKPLLHQIVMGVQGPKYRVGHLNGDPLDCRRVNLVVRTPSEQKAATRKLAVKAGRPTSSRFKGVSRASVGARWTAAINAHGEHRPLGRFRSEIGAALAYDDAARTIFGSHAQLNFSDPEEIARMRAIAFEEENAAPPPFPPPGFIDRRGACQMFGISFKAWQHWERCGRVRCGQSVPRPFGKPGRCRIYPIDELKRLLEEFSNVGRPYPDPERRECFRVPIRSMIHRMEATIDAVDLPLVEGKNWNWAPKSDGYGARVTLATTGKSVQLARVIARVTDPEQKVSHLNRDPLDCRRENLVVRTMAEQAPGNQKMGTVNGRKYTSDFKGVSWDNKREKWLVQISKGKVYRHVGRFRDEIAAAEAYDEAARELFGEHAYLNFPEGVDQWLEAHANRAAHQIAHEHSTAKAA